jgi:predicted TIM-barrel fold metal-dependent hydrolase
VSPPSTVAAAVGRVLETEHSPLGFEVPAGACDCHAHVFGPYDRFPLSPDRSYMPGPAPLAGLIVHQQALGLERVVIVQPSVYGTDNSCMLDALHRLGPGTRGIAVVHANASHDALRQMHEAGVRGLRLNLETAGVADPHTVRRYIEETAAQAATFGWHIQIYAGLSVIAALHDVIRDLPVMVVFDHFARVKAVGGPDQPEFAAVLSLMRIGKAYVKLSAPRRISNFPDHRDVGAIAGAFLRANPERVLWGSDWPHPGARPGGARDPDQIEPFYPDDDGLALNRLNSWMGSADVTRQVLVENPARLYGF